MSYRIQRQCDTHNAAQRSVMLQTRFPVGRLLWETGDLLITGGHSGQRQMLLLQAIRRARERFPDRTAVVFTDSPDTERGLISLVGGGGLGSLAVSSPAYPNYDVFSGLRPAETAACLARIAEACHCLSSGIYGYALAFLSILDRAADGKLSLRTMEEFARNTDLAIAAWAADNGLEAEAHQVTDSPDGGKIFRSLLPLVRSAFSSLLLPEGQETGFGLSRAPEVAGTVCLRANTCSPEVLALCFAQALRSLAGRRTAFSLFLDDALLMRQSAFGQVIEELQGAVPLTIAVGDAAALRSEDIFSRFSRDIILLDGEVAGVQKALASLGEYTHFEPARTVSGPAKLFWPRERSVSDGILSYTRPNTNH